jgi:hypothetical protein
MSALKKIAGVVAGISAVATIGVAVAQGVPPNPFITNPALAAGQQSSHLTAMGETGVPALIDQRQAVAITPIEAAPVAVAPAPEPAPAVQEQQAMGAPAAAEPAPAAPMAVAKADRN